MDLSVKVKKTINFQENIMPESPDPKSNLHQSPPTSAATMAGGTNNPSREIPRPHSGSSNLSGININGLHSPLGLNGRSSPSSLVNASQQLPPACGARQLSKLKRFLTTLQQFGSDISPEIGERVRTLVLGLVNSHLSIEEFHAKLQEATNFPLRPFVIPFLKANLPLLQRELLHCARMAKQTPQQYLSHNEHILFDATTSPVESQDVSMELNENGKRRSPDRPKENGIESNNIESMHPAKRHHPISPRVSPNGVLNLNAGPIRLEDISLSREIRERERMERERSDRDRLDSRDQERERNFNFNNFNRSDSFDPLERLDDDWRHVETMLNCIIGMVDKTKRALAVLQERSLRDREELSLWMRRHAEGLDTDLKKRSNDTIIRQTEERVTDVRRRAEEAVNEVKRQAMLELQKAVAAAEHKASELVASERLKMEKTLTETRKQAHTDAMTMLNQQEESSESCWNCGRKASETCSGCNTARYCGSFCQHKDWENHHHVCGKMHPSSATSDSKSPPDQKKPVAATVAAPTEGTSSPPATVPSPTNSVASTPRSTASRSSTPGESRPVEPAH